MPEALVLNCNNISIAMRVLEKKSLQSDILCDINNFHFCVNMIWGAAILCLLEFLYL